MQKCLAVFTISENVTGGVPDYDKAFKCFSIGADAMLPESTFRLSDMYCNGQGVWQDEILGTSVLKRIYIELLHDVTNNNISEDFADIAYRMGNIARIWYRYCGY